jgi:hypothetical protein
LAAHFHKLIQGAMQGAAYLILTPLLAGCFSLRAFPNDTATKDVAELVNLLLQSPLLSRYSTHVASSRS